MMKKFMVLCLIAGAVMTWAFPPYSFVPVAFVCFSVLFWSLLKAENKKQLFFLGFAFGFGEGTCSLFWVNQALLIDGGRFVALIPLCTLGFGLFFGIFSGISAVFVSFGRNTLWKLSSFAAGWTLLEWVRGWIFTGFPWNLVGSVWVDCLPVLQSASVVGIYGITLGSLFLFCSPILLIYKERKTFCAIISCFVLVALLGALRLSEDDNATVWGVKVRLVQPNIAQSLKWNPDEAEKNLFKHIRLSRNRPEDKITHVIWPEAATSFLLADDDSVRSLTISALRQGQVLLAGSLRKTGNHQMANSIVVIDDVGGLRGFYDKAHLVPFGEYVPFRNLLPLQKIIPIASDFVAGKGPQTIRIPNAPLVGMQVCYEIIFPGEVVDKKNRPSWILNVTNDAWYGMSAGPYQHLAASRFRAVEEGLAVVRATNNGISAVTNPYGRIIAMLDLGMENVIDSEIPRPIRTTWFGRFGNKTVLFVLALIFLGVGFHLSKERRLRKQNGSEL